MKIGFMQGRLVDSEKMNRIQYFPSKNWKHEIKLMKLTNFEIMEWTINSENINKNHLYNKIKNKELISFLKNQKINIPSVTCDFFMQEPFFKNKKFKHSLLKLKKVISLSKNIGIKYIILPLVDFSSIENVYQEKFLINELKKLTPYLGKDQNILFEIDYPPNKILDFIRKFNNKFGINYDTGNSASLGYSLEEEKKYFKYVKNIHIKDRLFRGHTVRPGNGDYDFKKFFSYLKKIKYNKNLILQTARAKDNIKEILINKKFVENFI